MFLLNKADRQSRDTIRKHHVFDIESALLFAQSTRGTVPPYDQAEWCGSLQETSPVRQQIEEALREQSEQYANLSKPFPTDPTNESGYFYWKRTPDVFELYALLEEDKNGSFSTAGCASADTVVYTHGLNSALRKDIPRFVL
jgi:hypothetical protein